MRTLFFLIMMSAIFSSCNNLSNDIGSNKDVDSSMVIPVSSDFIIQYTNKRKEQYKTLTEYNIRVDVVVDKPDFYMINFTEKINELSYPYCIVINPSFKNEFHQDVQEVYNEIYSDVLNQNLPFSFYFGNVNQTLDFSGDGSRDYILTSQRNFRTTVMSTSELLTYDGKRELKNTNIISRSDFESGICENIIGVKEELIVDNKLRNITLKRQENSTNGGCDETDFIKLSYEKVWLFENEKLSSQGYLNSPALDTFKLFKEFPKKFTFLSENNGQYVINENCQNGGANVYEFFLSNTSQQTHIYILKETADNIETYFVAGFRYEGDNSAVFYLRPTSATEMGGNFEDIENAKALNEIRIFQDKDHPDQYWISIQKGMKPNPATIQPDNYPFVKC